MTEHVIPEMVAYKAIMKIRDIQLRKYHEEIHEKEKEERRKAMQPDDEEKEEEKEPEVASPTKTEPAKFLTAKQQEALEAAELLAAEQKKKEEEAKERKKYGRFWIWTGYFNEKFTDKFLETAEMLKHVNEHVLEDIEDYILLKGFRGMKPDAIRDKIEQDRKQRVEWKKKQVKTAEEREKIEEVHTEFQRKRDYMNKFRPHTTFWNLMDDNIMQD